MELMEKQGFTQTEVGIIPDYWEVNPLEYYFDFISYGFTNPMPTTNNGIFMVTARDVNYGEILYDSSRLTSEWAYNKLLTKKSKPIKNDILLTKDGTLGRLAIVGDEKICINQSVAIIRPNTKVYPLFLKKLLESNYYQRVMLENAGGSTIKHIYVSIVNKMLIGVPPTLTEQKAIATALSDVDDLIAHLDKLITKKKAIKQGAMQQLLIPSHKGGKRLAGFTGEWKENKLGDIGECIIGLTYSPSNVVNSGTLVLRSSNIQNDQLSFKDNVYVNSIIPEKLRVRKGDILVCVRNGSRRLIGKCAKIDERCEGETFGAFMSVYRSQLNDFISHAFKSYSIEKQIEENLGATINQITNGTLNSFKVWLPVDGKERIEIVKVLDEMDAEIVQYQEKKSKYQLIKQGMMQELLTGKTRLV
jgi:type I restriction enzyme S subunit